MTAYNVNTIDFAEIWVDEWILPVTAHWPSLFDLVLVSMVGHSTNVQWENGLLWSIVSDFFTVPLRVLLTAKSRFLSKYGNLLSTITGVSHYIFHELVWLTPTTCVFIYLSALIERKSGNSVFLFMLAESFFCENHHDQTRLVWLFCLELELLAQKWACCSPICKNSYIWVQI